MPANIKITDPIWARYCYLRDNGHNDFVKTAKKCEDFFAGVQWEKSDLAILKASRRPALVINQIMRTVANVLGEQIYNRSEIAFRPRNEGATSEVADALTKVYMQISDNNQLAWLRSDMFCDGLISGRGYLDLRLDFSDSLRGEVRITPLNPRNVLPDSDADQMDPDTWDDVIVTKWMCADEIELLYSKVDADMLRAKIQTGYISPYASDGYDDRERFGSEVDVNMGYGADSAYNYQRNIRVIERQHRVLARVDHFVDLTTGDLRQVPDSWSPEQVQEHMGKNPNLSILKRQVRKIRWTVIADNIVLHDDWSPYKHFTVIPFFPYFRRGRTIGLVENLIGPQELLNKVSSQELHVVNTTANSGWKVKTGALRNMNVAELEKRGAETGLVLELDDIKEGAEKIQPNQIPSGLDRISFKAEEHIKSISGVSDYQTGNAREDVSAKAISQNKQSGSTNLAKVMDNLNRTDHILARNTLDLIQEFYTEPRLVTITSDRLSRSIEQLQVNEITPEGQILNDLTLGEYAVISTTQPERDTFEDNQFDQAVRLRLEAGIPIPDRFIIQSSRLRDKAAIVQEMTGNQDSPEAKAQAELQQRGQIAEISAKEGEAAHKHAQAQKAMAEAQEAGQGDAAKLREVELKMAMEERKMQMEMAMEQRKMEFEMELQKQKLAFEQQLKQMEVTETLKTERAVALHQAAQKPATPHRS